MCNARVVQMPPASAPLVLIQISQEVESILRLQISVLRANVEELSVEVVRLKTVAE